MNLPIRKIFSILGLITVSLIAIYTFFVLAQHFFHLKIDESVFYMFNINKEANVPTWYSTILLYLISVTSFLIYFIDRKSPNRDSVWQSFWLIFGIVFCFFSLDEAAMIHELFDKTTSIKWIFIYAPIFGLFFFACIYYFLFIRKDDIYLRNWIVSGLIVYVLGGFVSEWVSYAIDLNKAFQYIEFVVEEGLEMIGAVLICVGCLNEFNLRFNELFAINVKVKK